MTTEDRASEDRVGEDDGVDGEPGGEPGGDRPVVDGALLDLARSMVVLMSEAHRLVPPDRGVADAAAAHLGIDPATVSVVRRLIPVVDRPNLQLALDAIMADQPGARLLGLSPEIGNYQNFSASTLLAGRFQGPSQAIPPVYEDLPIDVDRTLPCVTAGVWLFHHGGVPVVAALSPGQQWGPPEAKSSRLEILSPDPAMSDAALAHLDRLSRELNVYRGKVLAFTFSEYGDFGLKFMARPNVGRDDIVLPEGDLAAVDRHAIGIARQAGPLRAAGQHLKRGLLLYGPPGTGKTLTISYLITAMPERTTVILQGPSLAALGQAAAIVRVLSPAMLVIEDVDLIAVERGGMDTNPLLFQLMNEMDGLAPLDDVLFVLTTNRLDMVEPALVARPGRIDEAVEIARPDRAGLERLLRLYLANAGTSVSPLEPVIDRLEGVTASFVKELVRRAVFNSIGGGPTDGATAPAELDTGALLGAADDLLTRAAPVIRALLGGSPAGTDGVTITGQPGPAPEPGPDAITISTG